MAGGAPGFGCVGAKRILQGMTASRYFSKSIAGWVFVALGLGLGGCINSAARGPKPAGVDELLERADRAFEGGRFAEASELYKLTAAAASTKGNVPVFVEAAAQVSSSLSLLGQAEQGRSWLAQAQGSDDVSEQKAHARVLLANALHLRDMDQPAASLFTFDELYSFCTVTGWWAGAMQAATLASVVAEGSVRVDWCQRSLDAARSAGEPTWVAAGWQGLGFAQESVGDFTSAAASMREARRGTSPGGRGRLRADWALAHMLRLSGEIAEARRILNAATPVARRFHSKGFTPRDAEWLGRCFEELAEVHAASGQKRNALAAMKSARRAYMLAEIQSLAPAKLRALEARVAQWKYELDGKAKD